MGVKGCAGAESASDTVQLWKSGLTTAEKAVVWVQLGKRIC